MLISTDGGSRGENTSMTLEDRLSAAEHAARQLKAASWLPGLVTPDYAGSCIVNVPGAIVSLLAGDDQRHRTLPSLRSGGYPAPLAGTRTNDQRGESSGAQPAIPFPALDAEGAPRR